MKLNLKYASDVLGNIEEYRKGSIVLAKLQTGTGKTTAIIGADEIVGLMDRIKDGQSIIYLCNRLALKSQVKLSLCRKKGVEIKYSDGKVDYEWLNSLKTIGNVTVLSYQELQSKIYNSGKILHDNPNDYEKEIFSLGDYTYIVADEFHYVVKDAGFNTKTMLCYNEIFKTWYDKSVLLLLTATDFEVKNLVENLVDKIVEITSCKEHIAVYGKNRVFKKDTYYRYIDGGTDYSYLDVKYYKSQKDMLTTIKNSEDKWLWFVSNRSKGEELASKLDSMGIDAKFISADDNVDLKRYIVENERFECKVLISTSVLDNGVNIKDSEVRNVVIETFDEITFIQMLGRKRINILNAETVNLYIPMRNSSNYTQKINKLENKLDIIRLYEEDISKLKRITDYEQGKLDGMFYRDYDDNLRLNEMYIYRAVNDLNYYKRCADSLKEDKWYFIKEQLSWLGLEDTFDENNLIKSVVDDEEVNCLEGYLESLIGKRLYKEEQRELINRIDLRVDRKQQKSISKLNSGLEMLGILRTIKSKQVRENGKKVTIWYIE